MVVTRKNLAHNRNNTFYGVAQERMQRILVKLHSRKKRALHSEESALVSSKSERRLQSWEEVAGGGLSFG